MSERTDYGLPSYLLPIYNFDDGCMAYLDHSSLNESGEPRVVMMEYTGSGYELVEVLNEDFGDFVLLRVREAGRNRINDKKEKLMQRQKIAEKLKQK